MRSFPTAPEDEGSQETGLRSIGVSTPWTEILLEEQRKTPIFSSPVLKPKPSLPSTYRSRFSRSHKGIWFAILATIAGFLYFNKTAWRSDAHSPGKSIVAPPRFEGLQFVNASHPFLRFVGRWTSMANDTRKEGSFPGLYFDFEFTGSTTVFLSLQNANEYQESPKPKESSPRLNFLPAIISSIAGPISLLVRVDNEEYTVFPNATSIVRLRYNELDPLERHYIRIIAPITKGNRTTILQVNGIYIDQTGLLLPPLKPTTLTESSFAGEKSTSRDWNKKMLEIVTDLPGAVTGPAGHKDVTLGQEVLCGVLGWDYLLGEMFEADHVSIGLEGMCLTQNCIGGIGSPLGLSDVFFRSGPLGSEQYEQPWAFEKYVPDVMVMNLGNSDWESFQTYSQEYNKSIWDLSVTFEESYVSLIKRIRRLAYPADSATAIDFLNAGSFDASPQRTSAVPIFVMRPLRGQLEGATHAVVDRLRKDGDKSVFWLDTSGWLDTDVDFDGSAENQDFFLDEENAAKGWRLTQRGNQRVAILLHLHVCRFLAREAEKCAFLPPEIYQGKAADPETVRFEEYLEGERERKLKGLFWEE